MMTKDLGTIRLELKGGRVEQAPGETVGIRIFNFDFYIDLLGRGGLVHWAQQNLAHEFHVIDEHWTPQKQNVPTKKRYGLRLEGS